VAPFDVTYLPHASLALALVAACSPAPKNLTGCDPNTSCPVPDPSAAFGYCAEGMFTSCINVGSENQNCPDVVGIIVQTTHCPFGCVKEGAVESLGMGCNVAPDAGTGDCRVWCDGGASASCNTCSGGVATTCVSQPPQGECSCAPPKLVQSPCESGCDDAGVACAAGS
jgi:hypothetical protein